MSDERIDVALTALFRHFNAKIDDDRFEPYRAALRDLDIEVVERGIAQILQLNENDFLPNPAKVRLAALDHVPRGEHEPLPPPAWKTKRERRYSVEAYAKFMRLDRAEEGIKMTMAERRVRMDAFERACESGRIPWTEVDVPDVQPPRSSPMRAAFDLALETDKLSFEERKAFSESGMMVAFSRHWVDLTKAYEAAGVRHATALWAALNWLCDDETYGRYARAVRLGRVRAVKHNRSISAHAV